MKKTIIIELTEEEKNFIKTCPPYPCVDCYLRGSCGGCDKLKDYKKRTEHMEKEVVELGKAYLRIKDLDRERNKMMEEREELVLHLRSCGVEV